MVAEARRDAVALRTEMVDRAKDEVEKLKNRSTRDIELARRKAVSDLADFATETSFRVARERLERGVSADDHDRLVAAALAEMDGRSS
jgi:F0F1-type ATP synthase membrane subunit b/b'